MKWPHISKLPNRLLDKLVKTQDYMWRSTTKNDTKQS